MGEGWQVSGWWWMWTTVVHHEIIAITEMSKSITYFFIFTLHLIYCCGSCILPTIKSPYSPTFQTSPLSSIHSESTIPNPVVWIWKPKSKSEQTGPEAPILPSPLARLFFLIPGCHTRQSRLLCRFSRVSTILVTLFVFSMVSSQLLHFLLSQYFLIRLSPGYPPQTIKFMYYRL